MTVQSFYERYQKALALQWQTGLSYGQRSLFDSRQLYLATCKTSPTDLTEDVACVVMPHGDVNEAVTAWCEQRQIPLLHTSFDLETFKQRLNECEWAPVSARISVPGTLLLVNGVGVFLQGKSGIGKSDLALGLIDRGHCLVADDLVELRRDGDSLVGSAPEGITGFMEIRGLGIVDVKRLYGEKSLADHIVLNLVLDLESASDADWHAADRLGVKIQTWQRMGVDVPMITMSYTQARNMPLLVEVAVRHFQLKQLGHDAALELEARLMDIMRQGVA